ncbi:MFS transporter [Natranaerobius thermophilus]|uniref:Major facilitator superfamily MFS_1 n=1 Tax=Natranaerobius thermophilus (strain ATCC BAA-1301 / DSM 18059 / JW/NM-WN-LF) TaxID=457570 RepID=B2A3D1_NATTJ|nr:MFS transporter [Natranaerobius thermophilus]ACB86360.1 major facilitator superfamily MFS_1 [Natranaerobius thermophilus JW/NM-WN-LF]
MSAGTPNQNKSKKLNWATLMVMSTAYMAVVLNMQGIKALLPRIQQEFMITGFEAGLYSTFYFASATLIAIYSGRIVDSIGPKRGLIFGVGSVGILIILQAISPTYLLILFLAFFAGFGFSIVTPSASKGVLNIVPKEKRAFSLGVTQSGASIGGILGALILPPLAEVLGWRTALLFSAGFAILMSLFIVKFYKTDASNQGNGNDSQDSNQQNSSLKDDVFYLLKFKYLVWICVMGAVFGMGISSVATHLPLYLQQDIGFGSTLAGIGLAVFQAGGILAHLGWGWFSDSVLNGDRRTALVIVGILVAVLSLLVGGVVTPAAANISPVLVMLSAFLLGLTILGLPALYLSAIGEAVEDRYVGTATGIALTFVRVANVIFPPIFGLFADLSGDYGISWIFLGLIIMAISISFYWFTKESSSYQTSSSRTV